jgi:transposase-like protein
MRMSDNGTANVWRRLLESFTPGEMTVREWCEQQGVSEHQYYYWRRRITAPPKPTAAPETQWIAVEVSAPAPVPTNSSGLTLRIAGAEIQIQSGFDPILLRTVVHALGP